MSDRARAIHNGWLRPGRTESRFARSLRRLTECAAQMRAERDRNWIEPEHPLTERERTILQLRAYGMTIDQIAATAGLSNQTIKDHLAATARKLGMPCDHSTPRTMEMVRRALLLDLIDFP